MTMSSFNEIIAGILGTVRQSRIDRIAIAALILLLIGKELIRAYGGMRTGKWMRVSNWAIAPLLLLFALFVLLYVADIVSHV